MQAKSVDSALIPCNDDLMRFALTKQHFFSKALNLHQILSFIIKAFE